MTSSNTLKKLVSIGAAMLLAVGGSLVAAEPAHAAAPLQYKGTSTAGPAEGTTLRVGNFASNPMTTDLKWANSTNNAALTYESVWFACATQKASTSLDTTDGTAPSSTFRSDCLVVQTGGATYTAVTGDLDKFIGVWVKATDSVKSEWAAIYSATSTAVQAAVVQPTLSGLGGSYSGSTGTPFAMTGSWTTTGLTGTVSYTNSGSLQSGLSLSSTTGIISGTPIESRSGTFTITATGSGNNAQATATVSINITATVPTIAGLPSLAPGTGTIVATPALTTGSWSNAWYLCDATRTGGATVLTGSPSTALSGCALLFDSGHTGVHGSLITIATTYYVRVVSGGSTTWPAATLSGKYLVFAQSSMNADFVYSDSISADATPSNLVAGSTSSSTPIAEEAKPLPVWAAPILKQIPTLSKTLNTDGGKVSLTDGDFSSLTTVTVGGKEVTFSTDAKGNVNIPIPAGAAGTTADLVVTFTGGKMVIQDGIKYVAPTDVAKVAEAGVAGFKANSSKVSGALAASILYAAQIDHKANAIACSGYAASKAQVALATARAQAACDYATGAYSNLTKSTVAVIVNKAKAKSASVGIKVYH
jgi:hypothetical protein